VEHHENEERAYESDHEDRAEDAAELGVAERGEKDQEQEERPVDH
jgi:hypothetical protein